MALSALRQLVDVKLEQKGMTLAAFVAEQRAQDVGTDLIWLGLRALTDVDVSRRTFYRWLEDMKEAA